MNSQLKSRQISSTNPNQSNISQNNLTSKPSSKNQHSVKKFNQVLSQNVTPRKKETSGNVKPKAHKKQASNNYKENEQYQQLFMERKKSQDYHQQQQQHPIISQSTKVSPNRPSNGPINSQIPLQNKFSNKQIQNCYEFKKQQTSNDPSSQYTLRIPYYENDKNHINTISYQNYEIDTITPDIISQTQNMHNQKGIVKKDVSQTIISGGNSIQAADDLGIDSSIHQSFINLIYPSKSKKKLANESAISNSIQASQPQKYSKGGNHQKSKSLFIGVNTQHFAHMLKPTQNMAPNNHGYNKGVQKVQQSSYKKQASIFNYSQRLKELLDDTSVGGGDESTHHGAPNQKNPFQKHQIFSQQHSPSGHQGKTMISQQEMKLQKSLDKDCKSTFDKIINQKHEYLTINDPQAMNKHQAAHHNQTLDVNLQKHLFNPQQLKTSVTSSNTPSNSSKNMIQNKEIQNSKTHLRKPSQPVNNNYILEVAPSQQQLSFINEYPSQNPQRLSFKPQSNHSTIEVNRQASQEPQKQTSSIHYSLQQQIQFQQSIFQQQQQQQQLSQHREKKQHQPTQSKIVNKQFNNSQLCGQSVGTSSGAIGHHQRSQSDYIGNFQFSNNDSNSCETGVNTQFDKEKLRKFLNSDTYELITAELDFYDNQQESSITPIARETDRGSSFLQNYSQALLESQSHTNNKKSDNKQLNMFTLNLHDKTKLSQLQQSINSSNNQQENSTKSSIYHQRKMSYQHPVPNIFHGKKSPQKAQFVFKDHYQKLASKKKASPHHVNLSQATSQVSHQNSSIKIGINSSMVKPQQKSNAGSIRTSQAVSPVAQNHQNQINLTQQYQQVQNSMNSSQIKNNKQLSQYQHCSSAATIQMNGQKSNQDLKQQILLQATKHFQNQLLNKNSSSMIQNPTQSNIKSQSQIHIVQQNNHERQFKEIKSEKISPQQLSKDRQQPPHKMVANVQIDLLKGQVISVNNQSNHTQQIQNLASNMNHLNHPQMPKHHHKPSNSISNTNLFNINNSNCGVNIQNSQSLQNSFIKRKDSFVQQSYHQPNISTTRQSSPNNVNPLINNVNQPQFNYEQTHHNDKNKINKSSVMMQQHRHSVQNSPQKIQSLFQKSQKQSLHMKNASTSNIHFQAKNNQTVLSPSNKSGSLSLIKITSNNKSSNLIDLSEDGGECGRSSLIFSGGNVNKQRGTDVNYQQNKIQINEFEQRQSLMGPSILNQKEISETEQLLNQIRNNIMIQKGYKIQEITLLQQQPQIPQKQPIKEVKKDNYLQKQVNNKLAKITEGSLEQIHMETLVDQKSMRFVTPNDTSKYSQRHQNNDDSQLFNNYLQTDPNMSPYSKDVNKLKKMITFNFKKYNEPPATTSEFYRIGRVLGRGAFGKVNLAAHKISEQLVAIKSINKEFLKSEEDQRRKIMQEFAILKQSNHTSVVRLFDSFETNKHICFVMELCSGGDLLTYVRKRRKLKEDIAKYFFKQIIEGLAYIHHSKLIVHRDIKLDNILLDANGRIKICDFGVSKQVSSETERMTEQCGTPAYIAPEILKDKGYDGFKVDVWSAGVCLYAMLIGTVPFKASSMHELHHLIINGKYEIKDTKLSEHAINLIEQLLQVDPRKRLSAYEVLSHPWLKDAEDEMDIFTQKEKDTIKKEYLTKNIERVKSSNHIQATNQDTEVIFTEHNLDTKTNGNSLLKNASTKSIILAPFNSTVSDYDEEEKFEWPSCIKQMIVPKRCLKFAPKCKDLDRQYEQNNNADLDNGVYNNFMNDNEENKSKDEDKDEEDNKSAQNSQDSLEKSFKETELSSDDEKAEIQVEEARKQKLQQQSELQEFEKQIKMKYVKYQEPVEAVNMKIVEQISYQGLYPKDYLLKVLEQKEMNYATATYHLLLKKKQLILKFNQNGGDHSEFIHDQFE